ncbi:MAG TPA: hypothetical protein ENN07_03195 [candidate division Zixibacteria bacterium]|nr:hypothetical protein [candidate division Zixibacteria bacterium]
MRLFYLEVCCPNPKCGKSLLDEDHPVRNKPSLYLIVDKEGVRGEIFLSAFYDDYKCIEPDEPNLLPGDVVRFFCPHCGDELPIIDTCYCKAPRVRLDAKNAGNLKICTRKGCKFHSLEFNRSEDLNAFIEKMKGSC